MSDKESRKIILKAIKDQEIEAMVFTTSVYTTKKERDEEEKKEFQNAIEVYFADFHLMIDAHMHIQSLNITPMPLQWSTAYFATEGKAFVEQHQKGSTRREMNDMASGFPADVAVHDFGRIGRLSTDLVGKVFMCDAENNDFRRDLYWIIGADEESAEGEAGEGARLENLSGRGAERYSDNFYKNVAYYFKNNKVISQYIVLMMDLSFAHYWGKWYLPINLPMPFDSDRGFYFINDSIQIGKKSTKSARVMIMDVNTRTYFPNPEEERRIPLFHNVNLEEEFERFLIYIKYHLGLIAEKPVPFYFYFDTDTHTADTLLSMKIRSNTDKKHAEDLLQSLDDIYRPYVCRKYKHFLEPIPGDNAEIFEDFWKQCDHTRACALSYPLQFYTFYHYDPRRHYNGNKNYEMGKDNYRPLMKVDELKQSHAFFTYRIANKEFDLFEDGREVVYRGEFLHINPLCLDDMSYRDPEETYFDRLIKDHAQESVGKSSGNIKTNADIFPMINSKTNKGLFWGIKMYPALGYIPDDFTNYPHLRNFYQTCIKEEIPIMIHSSPLGMTIADPHNYIHSDRDFREGRLNSLKSQTLRAEELYNHPANWKNVLTTYNDLKICLAHFGGESLWTHPPEEVRAVDDKPDTRGIILDMINEFPNVYTDIACFSKAN
ncbi:MAG: hypothetical protein JXJ04_14630, partial [Spirochaetales bacterium]|nr:hypothetical protein [Spirochaetales bacterium]